MSSHVTHYKFESILNEGWELNPEESAKGFNETTEKQMKFIQSLNESENLHIVSMKVTYDVSVVLVEPKETTSEDLSTDFWVDLAHGNIKV